ncbi:MAG: D-amino acid dehydrogenase [Pseudomonadota bacterium]
MTKSYTAVPNIAIIGAGITGVTTAWALIQRGFDVTLYDRNRYAAMETSFANGGQLSASNAEVWNHWSSVIKGMKWMLRDDAPLKMSLSPSWHKYSWMAEFLANIPNYEKNTVATAKMAIAAREHLFGMAREAGVSFDLEKRGILHFYGNEKSLKHARNVNRLLNEAGLDRRELSPLEIRKIEPTLTGQFVGGFFTESDATGDIHKFSVGLADACVDHGAQFMSGTTVKKLTRQSDGKVKVAFEEDGTDRAITHDAVIVCAGVHSREFARQLGDRVNIYPVKGYSITVQLNDEKSQNGAPWTSLLDDDAKIVTSRLGKDRFRIAGTAEFAGFNRDIRANRVKPLIDWCEEYFPEASTEQVVPWAGLRPMMPNMMPKVGAGRAPGVFYNTGHGHLGWTLSGATADMIAAEVDQAFAGRVTRAATPKMAVAAE